MRTLQTLQTGSRSAPSILISAVRAATISPSLESETPSASLSVHSSKEMPASSLWILVAESQIFSSTILQPRSVSFQVWLVTHLLPRTLPAEARIPLQMGQLVTMALLATLLPTQATNVELCCLVPLFSTTAETSLTWLAIYHIFCATQPILL